jgi:hypothetical protein
MIWFAFVIEALWLFTALGLGSALFQTWTTSCVESASELRRIESNSNQTSAGVWENGAHSISTLKTSTMRA